MRGGFGWKALGRSVCDVCGVVLGLLLCLCAG